MKDTIRTFWPIFISIISVAVIWGMFQAGQADTKNDVKQIQETYVTREILALTLKPIELQLEQILTELKKMNGKG